MLLQALDFILALFVKMDFTMTKTTVVLAHVQSELHLKLIPELVLVTLQTL